MIKLYLIIKMTEGTLEELTKASVVELIELKFFECETRLRESMMEMILPYVKKQ